MRSRSIFLALLRNKSFMIFVYDANNIDLTLMRTSRMNSDLSNDRFCSFSKCVLQGLFPQEKEGLPFKRLSLSRPISCFESFLRYFLTEPISKSRRPYKDSWMKLSFINLKFICLISNRNQQNKFIHLDD